MKAKIYKPSKNAMQSGQRNTQHWLLEYEQEKRKITDSLIGWVGSGDMRGQIRLKFEHREEAISYAQRNEIPYEVIEPATPGIQPKSYTDNFKFNKVE